jgi:tRNA uridine 5-carboxymethylaminomethyl modification enzyme
VQVAYIQSIPGFEQAEIVRPGYAVEYDFVQPTILTHSLETKKVSGLFFAGQINGTTGYEEAAGQGIIAGINAALKSQGKDPFILDRSESYIGVMIDDLITLGVDEPYRMFTSRAERRLILRQDNVFARLLPYGYALGTIEQSVYDRFLQEQELVDSCSAYVLKSKQRPIYLAFQQLVFDEAAIAGARAALAQALEVTEISSRALLQIHAAVRYDGYIAREEAEVVKLKQFAQLTIGSEFPYQKIEGLSFELQQKLLRHRPLTIAQAHLIPGMTPAALSLLIYHLRKGFGRLAE